MAAYINVFLLEYDQIKYLTSELFITCTALNRIFNDGKLIALIPVIS
jgi:hypothetical protein